MTPIQEGEDDEDITHLDTCATSDPPVIDPLQGPITRARARRLTQELIRYSLSILLIIRIGYYSIFVNFLCLGIREKHLWNSQVGWGSSQLQVGVGTWSDSVDSSALKRP